MLPELAAAGLIATRVAGTTSVRIHGLQPGHVDVRLLIDEEVNSVRALPLCAWEQTSQGRSRVPPSWRWATQSASACPTHSPCVPGRPQAGSVTWRRRSTCADERTCPRSPATARA